MEANYGETEIKVLLQKVRIFNKEIGKYELFAITGDFDYAVKLSNGKLLLKLEELQDDERDALTAKDLEKIALRFTSLETRSEQNPPPKASPQPVVQQRSPGFFSTWQGIVVSSVVVTIAILVIINLVSSSGHSSSDDSYYEETYMDENQEEDTYEEVEMTLEEKEKSDPVAFLNASGTYRPTILGDKLKIKCEITNEAKVATFKDAIVRVTFFAASGTKLETKDFTIYEIFLPGETVTRELKVPNYSNVESIGWEVISAKVY